MIQISIMALYQQIGSNESFHEFIMDLLQRMGLSNEDLSILFSPTNKIKNMMEFGKCFVSRKADPVNNYEVYELAGDTCLNNAVVMYLLKTLTACIERKEQNGFQRDPRLIDYFNRLKAAYISTKEFNDIAMRLGFNDFLQIGNSRQRDDKALTDSFEAFIGCFELMVDRYIKTHSSHYYVSLFITYIFNSRHINYRPEILYDPITLLKETSDITYTKLNYKYDIIYQKEEQHYYLYKISSEGDIRCPYIKVASYSHSVQNKVIMAKKALEFLKDSKYPEWKEHYLRAIPTPQELGIDELC